MAERDRFELDLAAALRDYAVDAPTEVRPTELAHHFAEAYPHGRGVGNRWSFGLSPALALLLLLIGLLVALVAGTLAVGSRLLESREPLPEQWPALLEGMVTEEVEPGVFRVVNDGIRDLSSTDAVDVVAGYDGGIWLLREQGFLRFGSDGAHEWPTGSGPYSHALQVAPDGTLWVIPTGSEFYREGRGEGLRSTDGEAWSSQPCPGDSCTGVTVAPDGTLWASWSRDDGLACARGDAEGCEWWVGYLSPTGWQQLDGSTPAEFGGAPVPSGFVFGRLVFTNAGDLYGFANAWDALLCRYEDGVWRQEVFAPVVDVGPDGTVWQHGGRVWPEGSIDDADLARFADGEWEGWTSADLPEIKYLGRDNQFKVAPDGSLWSSMWRNDPGTDTGMCELAWGPPMTVDCDGLARFDGETLDRFLPGQGISMDIAADGSVWVLAGNEQGRDLYLITPEAVSR